MKALLPQQHKGHDTSSRCDQDDEKLLILLMLLTAAGILRDCDAVQFSGSFDCSAEPFSGLLIGKGQLFALQWILHRFAGEEEQGLAAGHKNEHLNRLPFSHTWVAVFFRFIVRAKYEVRLPAQQMPARLGLKHYFKKKKKM